MIGRGLTRSGPEEVKAGGEAELRSAWTGEGARPHTNCPFRTSKISTLHQQNLLRIVDLG